MLAAFLAALAVAAEPADWQKAESPYLKNITQVTKDFVRAGEGYFSPDGKTIIFQAEEKDTGNPFYQIFTMDLETGRARRVSTGVGKTTCSFFRPDGKKIIFASCHLDPDAKKHYDEEYQRRKEEAATGKRRRYQWDFDPHMNIFEANPDGTRPQAAHPRQGLQRRGQLFARRQADRLLLQPRRGRTASNSTSWTPTAERPQADQRPALLQRRPVLLARRQARHLPQRPQEEGPPAALRHQRGRHRREGPDRRRELGLLGAVLVQGRQAHRLHRRRPRHRRMRPNYDLYWMNIDTGKKVRLTFAPGADVLPVFSPDCKKLMWTSTRDGTQPSQLYIADFTPPEE